MFRRTVDGLAGVIEADRPRLPSGDADLLAWSVCAVLASPFYRSVRVDPAVLEDVLRRMADAAVRTRVSSATGGRGSRGGRDARRVVRAEDDRVSFASRRETLVHVATGLFGERGFHETSVDEIGEAAGIAGPSVYKHFAAKSDLLHAALDRGAQSLQLLLTTVRSRADGPAEELAALVRSYAEFALAHTNLVTALVSEVIYLPAEQQSAIRRLQHDYVAEWTHLLRAARPELDATTAALLTHGALGVVNGVAPIRHLRTRPRLDADLASVAGAVLRTS